MNIDKNIKEILLEERTTGGKLNVNVDEVIPRYLKNVDVQNTMCLKSILRMPN